jgi:hypothetical protein
VLREWGRAHGAAPTRVGQLFEDANPGSRSRDGQLPRVAVEHQDVAEEVQEVALVGKILHQPPVQLLDIRRRGSGRLDLVEKVLRPGRVHLLAVLLRVVGQDEILNLLLEGFPRRDRRFLQ